MVSSRRPQQHSALCDNINLHSLATVLFTLGQQNPALLGGTTHALLGTSILLISNSMPHSRTTALCTLGQQSSLVIGSILHSRAFDITLISWATALYSSATSLSTRLNNSTIPLSVVSNIVFLYIFYRQHSQFHILVIFTAIHTVSSSGHWHFLTPFHSLKTPHSVFQIFN